MHLSGFIGNSMEKGVKLEKNWKKGKQPIKSIVILSIDNCFLKQEIFFSTVLWGKQKNVNNSQPDFSKSALKICGSFSL